jgi:histidinol-phosphate aminotransferase
VRGGRDGDHRPRHPRLLKAHIFAENEGRTPVYARLGPDFRVDASAFLPAIAEHDPAIVFLTNPHSPTGRLMADADIEAVCEAAGPDRLVVLDEAYIHFTQTPGGIEIARRHDNLILLRTFSKAYGLAGLRIGFGLSRNRALIAPLMSLKPTWNMGNMQVAGGAAAIGDDEHVDKTVRLIVDMRDYITGRLAGLNRFQMIPNSRSNFFMIRIVDHDLDSTLVFDKLLERGVIVKDCSVSFRGLGKRYLRVDVNFRKHMDRLADALREIDSNV